MKSRIWYSDPAAPCEAPALIDRSRVAHPGVPEPEPEPPGPPEAEAEAPPGDDAGADEGALVCDPTACGVCDAGGAEVAGEDAAVVAGVGDDPGDAVQPAAAATAATAVTMPAARSSSEPEPVIPNHPLSCFAHPMMTPSGWRGLERDYPGP